MRKHEPKLDMLQGAIIPSRKASVPLGFSGGCTVLSIQPSTSILSDKALAALKYAFLQNRKVGITGTRIDLLPPPTSDDLATAEASYEIARELVDWANGIEVIDDKDVPQQVSSDEREILPESLFDKWDTPSSQSFVSKKTSDIPLTLDFSTPLESDTCDAFEFFGPSRSEFDVDQTSPWSPSETIQDESVNVDFLTFTPPPPLPKFDPEFTVDNDDRFDLLSPISSPSSPFSSTSPGS